MKILLIHYRYSIIGGPERYLFNIMKLLSNKGHEVIPFSINYDGNYETKYSKYFVNPVNSEFHSHKISKISFDAFKTGYKLFYNKQAYNNLNQLIKLEKPDIAYILLFSKFSNLILKSLKENNIPIILRISDFSYFCSRGVFLMKNEVCEKCLISSFHRVINKCNNDSLVLSIVDYLKKIYDNKNGYFNYVDELIIPSKFTEWYYSHYKIFKNAKINHIPTFALNDDSKLFFTNENYIKDRFLKKTITVFGRVSKEKGIETLLHAIKELMKDQNYDIKTNIIGFTASQYCIDLKNLIKELELKNIHCYEFLEKDELYKILESTSFVIIPSVCYDNMPNTLIEAQSLGIPVIASETGSFPELIKNSYNGFLFKVKNSFDLAKILTNSFNISSEIYSKLSNNSIKWTKDYCSEDSHYNKLISVFNKKLK